MKTTLPRLDRLATKRIDEMLAVVTGKTKKRLKLVKRKLIKKG